MSNMFHKILQFFGLEDIPNQSTSQETAFRGKALLFCGTVEDWEIHQSKYAGMHLVEPAQLYVSRDKVLLVTSKEWCDWLTKETNEVPK